MRFSFSQVFSQPSSSDIMVEGGSPLSLSQQRNERQLDPDCKHLLSISEKTRGRARAFTETVHTCYLELEAGASHIGSIRNPQFGHYWTLAGSFKEMQDNSKPVSESHVLAVQTSQTGGSSVM